MNCARETRGRARDTLPLSQKAPRIGARPLPWHRCALARSRRVAMRRRDIGDRPYPGGMEARTRHPPPPVWQKKRGRPRHWRGPPPPPCASRAHCLKGRPRSRPSPLLLPARRMDGKAWEPGGPVSALWAGSPTGRAGRRAQGLPGARRGARPSDGFGGAAPGAWCGSDGRGKPREARREGFPAARHARLPPANRKR